MPLQNTDPQVDQAMADARARMKEIRRGEAVPLATSPPVPPPPATGNGWPPATDANPWAQPGTPSHASSDVQPAAAFPSAPGGVATPACTPLPSAGLPPP
eukprot:1749259-Prymnesium_polylepis.1